MGRDSGREDQPSSIDKMKHVPHVVIGAPWADDEVRLSVTQIRHLAKVLRIKPGDRLTYTDGLGHIGLGLLKNENVVRGDERFVERPTDVVVAVAPPSNKERQRFLVEKLAELGVERLVWLKSDHGKNRVASSTKVFTWVLSAVEQSRGAWLMETGDRFLQISDLEKPVVVCQPGGTDGPQYARTVVIGPEGGFGDDELPDNILRWDLGTTILRVETAALTAVARMTAKHDSSPDVSSG